MKLISLAIASIVDANLNQNYSQQYTHSSAELNDSQIKRGRLIRSKSIFDFAGSLVSGVAGIIEKVKERRQERRGIEQLLKLNDHMQQDIGLIEFDLQGLKSGTLTLNDLRQRRKAPQSEKYSRPGENQRNQFKTVRKSILEIESANQDCFELAKCS